MTNAELINELKKNPVGFIETLNSFDVRVWPPRVELTAQDLMPTLSAHIQGDVYGVAAALATDINKITSRLAKRVGFQYRDPATGNLVYLNRAPSGINAETGETIYGWSKGREVQAKNQ